MLRDFLRRIPLFTSLEDGQLRQLEGMIREEDSPAKRVIFREGDPVDAFYIVKDGLVTVYREEKGKPLQVLARLESGGYFGEMGLLNDRARRFASARTTLPSVLLRIEKPDLVHLLAEIPILELKFRAEVIRRHGMNVSALLSLAGQRDVRIRIEADAEMVLPDGDRTPVTLENLSIGGIGLSGPVPARWDIRHHTRFALALPDEVPLLEVVGTVTWKEGATVGIAFDPEITNDPNRIYRVIRTFLDSRR
ncbi:MAG TPA: cyclic nucleotide-binding domain-containing protein [Thermoanaerobaculia bacterium]|nr:cyclic nucleotide-binding domain-containing protein [Thermoanaerobaculia bacterium]